MPRSHAPYPPEFKAEAVKLYRTSGKSLQEISADLEMSINSLREWVRRAEVNEGEKLAWATGGGGLRRPIQLTYGPDGALHITDFGVILFDESGMTAQPNTGVVWKVSRTQ